ncbi:HAD family hydrolase [Motilimonas pumila]|uniref:HAD family hydrolase n=1 Tax=Motilimonas pumila TaxID=2303987 RepID=A0A418YBN7_9GAMM|nr:HAD family hydrolase [Motilimonas pumila]RJG41869.1 HAD family hydrolase [Motilimonas pumila]
MNLALFDFDGTITTQDTYTRFLFYATSKTRMVFGWCLMFPVIALYKLKLLKANKTRPALSRVAFAFRKQTSVTAIAEQFVQEYISKVLRPEMLERIQWHLAEGDRVIVVSASLDVYLRIWCKQQGIELLCSELMVHNGRYTGGYVDGDCSEQNKVKAIKGALDLNHYPHVYGYGDTYEDLPMLSIAQTRYYQGEVM